MQITSGIPTIGNYHSVLESDIFAQMKSHSDSFLESNRELLQRYGRKWVGNSFLQWSRQWEYPFVFDEIRSLISERTHSRVKVLDAGSGVTFFPYFLTARFDSVDVNCIDSDHELPDIYSRINSNMDSNVNANVHFSEGSIESLPFSDGEFQAIYCVSVLEHVKNYAPIIREFKRCLAPKGALILTFDISLDGDADVQMDAAKEILAELHSTFPGDQSSPIDDLDRAVTCSDVLTTEYFWQHDKTLLPWKHPLIAALSALRKGRLPKRWGYKKLTVFCGTFR